MTNKLLISVIFFLIFVQTASALYSVTITPDNGSRPFQFNMTISNASGVNTVSTIYLNAHGSTNFTDVYFTDSSGNTLNHYRESNTSGKHWINLTSNGTFTLWYGNASHTDSSNGSLTFPSFCCSGNTLNTSQWSTAGTPTVSNGVLTINAVSEAVYTSMYYQSGYAMEFNMTASATTGQVMVGWGLCPVCVAWNFDPANTKFSETRNTTITETNLGAYGTSENRYGIIWKNSSNVEFYFNNAILATHTTNIPSVTVNQSAKEFTAATYTISNMFVRNHPTPLPAITAVGTETLINYIPIVASNNIKYSNDTEIIFTDLALTEKQIISITESYSGSWKISFDLFGYAIQNAHAQIYKNNVPYGTFQTTAGYGYTTFTQTFSNINILQGDISLYAYLDPPASSTSKTRNFRISFDYDYTNYTPTLTYPTNGSTLSFNFPPQVSDINFTWTPIGSSGYQIQVAEDAGFSLIEVDTTTTSNYSVQSIDGGTHYWRVRTYNDAGATLGNWSDTFSFLFTEVSPSVSGAAINGVVYFLSNGAPTPLADATVFIYNSTFTAQQTTGSNGYFLFQNLANGTVYYIKASLKDYQTSEIITINVSGVMTYNIQMKPVEPTFFENDKQYVLFTARYMFCWSNCDVEGATMTVYKYGEATPVQIGAEANPKITDTTGSASFLLFKTQKYRITLVNASAGVSNEMTLYPKDTEYLWLITRSNDAFQDHDILEKDAIITTVSKSVINSTHAYINVTYNDTLTQTTNITIYLNQSNSTMLNSSNSTGNMTVSFIVNNYQGKSYLIHFFGQHTEYGTIDYTYSVLFEKTDVGISGIPSALWLWFGIGISFFVAAIFTASTVELGLIIVCGLNWVFVATGVYGAMGTVGLTRFVIALTLISVLAVMAYAKKQQTKEGYT